MMNYAIVGGGRLARHFSHYFQLLEIPHTRWTRDAQSSFNTFELPDAEQCVKQTIEKNIQSLDGDPLQDLYRAFVHFYQGDERSNQVEQNKLEKVS